MNKNHIMKMDKAISINNEARVEILENEMLKHEQINAPVTHRFGPGTYIREVFMPAGTLAIGHKQNFEHTNIMLKGRVTMLNDDGTTIEYRAPMIFTGKPGRKIGFIHEDMIWLNVYPNLEGSQDIEQLESKWLTKSEAFTLAKEQQETLWLASRSYDEKDFEAALLDLGTDKETVWTQSINDEDMTYLPDGAYKFKVSPSVIHGKGIFAVGEIQHGEIIGPARVNDKRTVLGRYTNHGRQPNAKFSINENGNVDLIAIDKIFGCRGGFDGDEITVDYRDAAKLAKQHLGVTTCQE